MADVIEAQVFQTAADVFGVPVSQLNADSSPTTVEGWDSVQHLNFVLALEQACEISIDPEEIEDVQRLGDAVRLVQRKKAN